MVEIEFIYNQQTTIIQAKPDEPLKDVINKFLQKSLLEEKNVFFISNGKPINSEKTVESHMNQMNKENNKLKILAQITEEEKDNEQIFVKSKDIICPICHEPCIIKTENYKGVYSMAKHLVEHHNAKKIMYLNGVKENVENLTRRQALIDVLAENGLTLFGELYGDFSFYSAYLRMSEYLKENKELPDAVVCANDLMALGANYALYENSIRVPEDILLTGFDMIKDGQRTFPILSSVSRGWETFGETAYDKLKYQMEHPDERFCEVYDSYFVPSESCGCVAAETVNKNRFDSIRRQYFDNLQNSVMDIHFQRIQIPLSLATKKTDFFDKGLGIIQDIPMFGKNYCLCTEPEFFEMDDDEYPERIRGYSSNMDVLYELRDGEKYPLSHFDSRQLYPGYTHKEGESNLFVFAPLNYLNFIIVSAHKRKCRELV